MLVIRVKGSRGKTLVKTLVKGWIL
jgi:hypothetical protein